MMDNLDEIDELYAPEPAILERDKLHHWQELYPHLSRRPYRFSHSGLELYHSCERKYHLLKNLHVGFSLDSPIKSNKTDTHLDYGTAIGDGVQELLASGDLSKAIWTGMSSFHYADQSVQKCDLSIVTALQAIDAQWKYEDWEVIARELSFKILLDKETEDYYCGYVDAVLRNVRTGIYCVVEVKTTGYKIPNLEPIYSNSGQGIGYSVVLDQIAKENASWTILYIVIQLKSQNIIPTVHIYPFEKTKKDRLEWLLTTQLDYKHIIEYEQMNYWPKRGGKCLTFNRPCPLYGLCDLHYEGHDQLIKKEDDWSYTFFLDDLIRQQMAA